jgi:hypothetical protein
MARKTVAVQRKASEVIMQHVYYNLARIVPQTTGLNDTEQHLAYLLFPRYVQKHSGAYDYPFVDWDVQWKAFRPWQPTRSNVKSVLRALGALKITAHPGNTYTAIFGVTEATDPEKVVETISAEWSTTAAFRLCGWAVIRPQDEPATLRIELGFDAFCREAYTLIYSLGHDSFMEASRLISLQTQGRSV